MDEREREKRAYLRVQAFGSVLKTISQLLRDRSIILYLILPYIPPDSLNLLALLTRSINFWVVPIFSVHLPISPAHNQFNSHNISSYLNDGYNAPIIFSSTVITSGITNCRAF